MLASVSLEGSSKPMVSMTLKTHISRCDALAYLYLMGFSLSPLKKASAKLVDWVQDTAAADTGKISAS